jgi:hypothetical protein
LDEVWVILIELQESILIFRESEKIVLLGKMLYLLVRMIWTAPIDEIRFFLECFTPDTIHPIVYSLIDITIIISSLEDFLDEVTMSRLCRTDEVSISDPTLIPDFSMLLCHGISIFHHGHVFLCSFFDDLLGILIDSRRELHIIALETLV